jgi:integrase
MFFASNFPSAISWRTLCAGVDVKTVSEQAGHASVAFTPDNYAHVLSTMKQGASDKLESLLRYSAGTL